MWEKTTILVTIIVKSGLSKNHQWRPNLGEKVWGRARYVHILTVSSHQLLTSCKEETVTLQSVKTLTNSSNTFCASWCEVLRRTQCPFCSILAGNCATESRHGKVSSNSHWEALYNTSGLWELNTLKVVSSAKQNCRRKGSGKDLLLFCTTWLFNHLIKT